MDNRDKLNAAIEFGLIIDSVNCDGQLHRVSTKLKPKSKNGWYIAFDNSPVIVMGDWQTGQIQTWTPDNYKLCKEVKDELVIASINAEKVLKKRRFNAAIKAQEIYKESDTAISHPYLSQKKINSIDILRVNKNQLIVPLVDLSLAKPSLMNLQRIYPNGEKRFLSGGKVNGLCCPLMISISEPVSTLYIAEGLSTAITIYEQTGSPTLAAMNANNLVLIAKIARKKWPTANIIIAGDDDYLTEQKIGINPGKVKAEEAASVVKGSTTFPPFTDDERTLGLTDWNDFMVSRKEVAER